MGTERKTVNRKEIIEKLESGLAAQKDVSELNISLEEYDDILTNAGLGVWQIILKDGEKPKMQINAKMAELLGVAGKELTEEQAYDSWYKQIVPDAIPSVDASVQEMIDGHFSENTYQWKHPTKGILYVRCGGTCVKLSDGTNVCRGYHADVTDIVLEDQRQKYDLEQAKKQAEEKSADLAKQLEKEQLLIFTSSTDELTGLSNRRAYENAIADYNKNGIPKNLVYISADVNGLKNINDTVGHEAGDELIIGASYCLKKVFGNYGKVYRTGGDEFIALILVEDRMSAERLIKNLNKETEGWMGNLVEKLSISCGYVCRSDALDLSLHEISIMADQRMYDAKSLYYRKKGVDRRGQREAYAAICALFSKILKINITEDTFEVIEKDSESPLSRASGFSIKLSKWFRDFARTDNVHPDDMDYYNEKTDPVRISAFFKENKKPYAFTYRRKCGEEFKQSVMEIVPAPEYEDDNQVLFLYVKNIEK